MTEMPFVLGVLAVLFVYIAITKFHLDFANKIGEGIRMIFKNLFGNR